MKKMKNSILFLVIILILTAGFQPISAQSDGWQTALSNVEGGETYYSVNFVSGGDVYLTALVSSGGLTLPEDPHKEGYKFLRWECEGQAVTDGMTVDHNLTINAVFEPIVLVDAEISYVYSVNGSEIVFSTHSATLTLEDVQNNPYTVISPEYTEVSGVSFWPERKSVTISADDLKAAASAGNSLHITVNYNPTDLSYTLIKSVTTMDGAGYQEMERADLTGHMGAEISAPAETAYGTLIRVENKELTQSGQTVNAFYQRKHVLLTFDTNGGEALPGPEVLYGQTVELEAYEPTRKGYRFSGWLDEDSSPVTAVTLTEDRTVTAKWEAADSHYSVVYYKEMFSGSEVNYEYAETEQMTGKTGTTVSVDDSVLTKDYKGYEPDEKMNAASSVVIDGEGSAVLPVYYKLSTYEFSFDLNAEDAVIKMNGRELKNYSFEARLGEPIASKWPTEVTRPNYYFNGWDNYLTKRITLTADMLEKTNYTARWTEDPSTKTVNYWLQNAEGEYVKSDELSQTVYTSGTLNPKTLTGYTHIEGKDSFSNDTYDFYYDRETYVIKYYDGAENLYTSDPIRFGAGISPDYTVENPSRELIGWHTESGAEAPAEMPSHDLALYAMWKDPQVTFVTDDSAQTVSVPYGTAAAQPADPVKAFHSFTGWYTAGGERWNFSARVTENVTLYAHFTEDPHSYTIRYLAAESGAPLHAEKTVTGAEVGEVITEQAVRIAGWLAEEGESSLTVAEDPDQNVLVFRYVKAPETLTYTVRYLRAEDNTPVREAAVHTVSGDKAVVYEFAPEIEGLYAAQLFQSVMLTAGTNEITFYYNDYKTASLTVRMLDMDGELLPGREAESFALRIGESFDGHVDVDGYSWDHAAGLSVFTATEADAGKSFEMELYYRKKAVLRPADLSKIFDGEALVAEGTENVIADGLAEGHSIEAVVFSGSQTEVGESASAIESVTISGPKSGNDYYAISFGEGTLTVTEPVMLRTVKKLSSSGLLKANAAEALEVREFKLTLPEGCTFSEETGCVTDRDNKIIATYSGGVLTILSGDITISNIDPNVATTNRIVVAGDANVTLAGVNIEAEDGPAIKIEAPAECTIHLEDGTTNTLKGAEFYAGIEVGFIANKENPTASQKATLTIEGKDGKLISTGGKESAGIGGNKKDDTLYYGNIIINGGDITAIGGTCKDVGHTCGTAGIGSGDHSGGSTDSFKIRADGKYVTNWGEIQITGGTIKAYGESMGAGIGGGNHVDSGKITITGGKINAYGYSGIGAGLGSSKNKSDSGGEKGPGYYFGDITITGGEIEAIATPTGNGSGIGGGMYSDAIITITGGTIFAKGGTQTDNYHHGGAGIGGGYEGHAIVTITGGTITAEGGGAAAGIGSGGSPNNESSQKAYNNGSNPRGNNARSDNPDIVACESTIVTISGGTVTATAGKNGGAGIGGGTGADKVTVNISGGTVTAFGAPSCNPDDEDCTYMAGGAGIGGGTDSYNALAVQPSEATKYFVMTDIDVSITGGNVIAIGGWGASGIGSGAEKTGDHVYTDKTKITTSPDANIIAYADGTKFAIDTRLLDKNEDGSDGLTHSKQQEIAGNVLQGTFVHEYNVDGNDQNPEGLSIIKIFDSLSGEQVAKLTGMADFELAHYRSFATTVPHAGEYLVYTDVDKIGTDVKNGRYFACSTYDIYTPGELKDEIRYQVKTGELSDNFYLYPVKSIIVRKNVTAPDGIELGGLDKELTFSLKTKAGGQDSEAVKSDTITIKNGEAQNIAAFVNIPDNAYEVWEEPGVGSEVSGSFGTLVLKNIIGTSGSGDNNNGTISSEHWSESISFENVYETPTPEPPDVTDEPEPPEETPTPVIIVTTTTPEPPDETDEPEPPTETPTPVIIVTTTTPTATPTVVTPTPTPSKTLFPIITPTATAIVPRETPTPHPTEPVPDNPPDPEYPELVFEAPSTFIDDYSIPLGLGEINLNAADCFE